jgi:aspartyl-tRNA(Asn)/glutamyl-tRNA(Gln) amidotransferase subunit B
MTTNRQPARCKAGKLAALNSRNGQVMKLGKGKANPALVGEILERKLKS